jgi:hypothetical protein
MQVSPETIYRSLFVQSRGVLRRCLLQHLRRQHHFRHARAGARLPGRQGQILHAVSIRERPAEVRDRAVPGHWEGDLLEGARGTFIATLVERQSRYVLLVRLPSKDTHTVTRAIAGRIQRLPRGLMKSLTWDRGGELAAHRAFTVATNVTTSVIHEAPGSAAQTRTRTACCASIFRPRRFGIGGGFAAALLSTAHVVAGPCLGVAGVRGSRTAEKKARRERRRDA